MPGIVTAVQDWASTISSRYHPICKQSACRPLAPSVTCGDSSLPEGAMGCCVSTLDLWELEVPTVNPSDTPTACQLPLAREPRAVPAANFARWLSTNRSFPDPPGIGGLPPNLFTIHSSLFSKSARYRYCGGSGCTDQSPPCQRGCLGTAEAGGFRRLAGFHIGLYFWESACCGIPCIIRGAKKVNKWCILK